MKSAPGSRLADWLVRWLWPLAVMVLLGFLLFLLHRALGEFRYHDIRQAVRAIPASRITLALALTAAAYAVLPGYDAVALAYIGRPLGMARTAGHRRIGPGPLLEPLGTERE
jgi:uncharacterized membrane protein YbhN (UPF0104 family)